MMSEYYISFEMRSADGTVWRARARYTQELEVVIEQAVHDVEVNNRVGVRVEDTDGKEVWPTADAYVDLTL